MSQQIYPYPFYPPPRTNGLGIAGFIVSLVGLISCGILSPIGLALSFVALFRSPRGFAIAGFVLGLLGTIWVILAFVVMGIATIAGAAGLGAMAPVIVTHVRMAEVAESVANHKNPDGTFPTDLAALPGISSEDRKDVWGHPFRIIVKGPNEFEVVSDGPDGIAGTSDDIRSDTSTDARPRHKSRHRREVPAD